MTLLEDHPHFTLWHDTLCACLYASWWGEKSGDLLRANYDLIHRHLCQTGSNKLLNDSLLDEDGWSRVACWLVDEGFGRLVKDGLQVVAWVLPCHPAAFYDTARVLASLQQPLVDTFTDAQAAYDWLHRWPYKTPHTPIGEAPLTAARFLLLPSARQVALAQQLGRALAPRSEADYYIKSYELLGVLRADIYYYLHSGVFYQIRTQLIT